MFNIGFGELVILLLIAFVIVGPDDLPKVARTLAKGIRYLRALFTGAKDTVLPKEGDEVIRDLRQELSETKTILENANPVSVVRKELDGLDPLKDVKKDAADIQTLLHKRS
ncbi:MAG: twin-arginine translocase TatA/TatE family subunit [Lachnospiraceae bacterium]|nr:twin-arginine translocase TatA/TatE family subunit [Lachnospiraceae bacterium]